MTREAGAVRAFAEAVRGLRDAGILRSYRLVGELGEWYAERIFGGKRSRSPTEKGWDILVPGPVGKEERLQVKTQRFDRANPWNYLDSDPERFTHLVVILLSDDYLLREVYKVPTAELLPRLGVESRTGKRTYHWKDLQRWRLDLKASAEAAGLRDLLAQ